MTFRVSCALLLIGASLSFAAEELPDASLTFIENHCLECHDADTAKGEIDLDTFEADWSSKDTLALWERVLKAVQSGEMPPKKKPRPEAAERDLFLAWIDQSLTTNSPVGGTLARRLNQAEYLTTVRRLFSLKDFSLPPGFPADREYHGFDNIGEGLVLSPPLLQAYAETASIVADQLFPPEKTATVRKETFRAGVEDLVISYSSGKVVGDALRLGMNCDPIWRSSTWPTRIEAHASGVYRLKIRLSTFRPEKDGGPMIAKVFARDVSSQDGVSKKTLRLLKQFEVTGESPETFTFEAELYEGQTPVVHWENAAFSTDRDDTDRLKDYYRQKDAQIPGYISAWNEMVKQSQGQGFRGGVGWERVKAQLARKDLPAISEEDSEKFLKTAAGNPVLYAETLVFDVFENGPSLEVHGIEIEGPLSIVDGPADQERQRLQKQFIGNDPAPEAVIRRFLTAAFRRPVDDATVQAYLGLHDSHLAEGHTGEEAMHLVIRSALVSPRFLYRSLTDGPLDSYDLATRLGYFLTGGPPDALLLEKAEAGKLTEPAVLRNQANRLLPDGASAPMITHFTGQWLDTRLLPEIMPDPAFKFTSSDQKNAQSEVEYFFLEMLKKNRPMTDFIDPDFTWTSARLAKNIYGLTEGFDKKKGKDIHRVSLPRGGRYGGVLGNAAVMMATANGVDTQPVLRGVWVLRNVLGTPPPPPPKSVPALTPDTRGAKTPRDLLDAHTSEESCASCHNKIDPVGFALENFDPVGRWRDNWPGVNQPIDASSTLPDGTEIHDIVDFKRWLVENIDQFSECLAGHLMTYATGRVPNYTERKEIAAIVEKNHQSGNGFRDLLLALVESETFRTK